MKLRHPIDPSVDCVFKALFADPANQDLLTDLLNGVLGPEITVSELQLCDPIHPPEFQSDDTVIVDVKARDAFERVFHVELQLQVRPGLATRMLYCWADLYQMQLKRGEDFSQLRPVISVWLLQERLFPGRPGWHHRFTLADAQTGARLSEHLRIDVVELSKWREQSPLAGLGRWVYFLNNAKNWYELPGELHDPLMEKAMSVLWRFSEKELEYMRYQSRMNDLRERETLRLLAEQDREEREALRILNEQMSARNEREAARIEREATRIEQVRAEMEREAARNEQVRAEIEREAARNEQVRAEIERERVDNERVRAELDDTKAALDDTKAALDDTKAEIDDTKAEIDDTKAELKRQAADLEDQRADLAAQRADLAAQRAEVKTMLEALDARLTALAAQLREERR